MKLTRVALLSAAGMLLTSWLVWTATPAGGAPRAEAPVGVEATPSASDSPRVETFSSSGTLQVEGRLGHRRLAADAPGSTFLLVSARPAEGAHKSAPGVNLAIVIDRSGSMKGRRMEHALDAARGMLTRLRDGDVVSVIAYDTRTETLVPPTTLDRLSKPRVLSAISGITASGDTCISCGLDAGMQALRGRAGMVNRILLLSDGEATAGVRDLDGFRRIAERARTMGTPISSIGVDVEYNERVLSTLALESNGRHHFAETELELTRAFDSELETLLDTVAKNAEIVVELAPGVRLSRVLDRPFRSDDRRVSVAMGAFSASEEKTLLLELDVPRGAAGERPIADVRVTYDDLTTGRRGDAAGKLSLELTLDPGEVTDLDPFVAARLGRTETADTLTQVNDLFKSGDVEGARRRVREQLDQLKKRRKAASAAAPAKKRPAIDGDFSRQEAALEKAEDALDQPAPAGQAPADTRKGKADVRRNQEVADPFRL